MNRFYLVAIVGFFCHDVFSQTKISSHSLQGVWIKDSTDFPGDTVKLLANATTHALPFKRGYEFLENGTVHEYYKGPGMCGNGLIHLENGTWSFKDQVLLIALTF